MQKNYKLITYCESYLLCIIHYTFEVQTSPILQCGFKSYKWFNKMDAIQVSDASSINPDKDPETLTVQSGKEPQNS